MSMQIDRDKLRLLRETKYARKPGKNKGNAGKRNPAKRAECVDLVWRIMAWSRIIMRGPRMIAIISAGNYGVKPATMSVRCLGSPDEPGPIRGFIRYSRIRRWLATPEAVRLYGIPAYHLLWTQKELDTLFGLEYGLVNVYRLEPEEVFQAVEEYAKRKYA